jgi:hypothetical protein
MSPTLRTVAGYNDDQDDDQAYEPTPAPRYRSPFPPFEGNPVEGARIRITGAAALDVGDEVSGIDDTVTLRVLGRVTGIDHKVDKVTGQLVRHHTVTVLEAVQLPTQAE